jgi:hypothetical protein
MSWKPLCVEMLNYVRISYILFLLFVPSKYPCSLLTHRPFLLPSSPNEHLAHPSTSAKPLSYGGTGLVLPKTRTTDSGPEDRLPRLRTISSTVWENDMVSVSYRERTLSSSYQTISPVLRPLDRSSSLLHNLPPPPLAPEAANRSPRWYRTSDLLGLLPKLTGTPRCSETIWRAAGSFWRSVVTRSC